MEREVAVKQSVVAEMNPTLKTIYQRRAVRKFKDIPVERKLIEQLLDVGVMKRQRCMNVLKTM